MTDQEIIKEKKRYKYDSDTVRRYNQTFKEKHKDEMIDCQVCFLTYSRINSHYHPISKRHKTAIKILENISNL